MKKIFPIVCLFSICSASYSNAEGLLEMTFFGLKNDTTYIVDKLNADYSETQINGAWANSLPNIVLEATQTNNDNQSITPPLILESGVISDQNRTEKFTTDRVSLTLSQTIYHHGIYSYSNESEYLLKSVGEQRRIKHQEALLRIVTQYFDTAYAQETIHSTLKQKQALMSQLTLATKQFEVGFISQSQVEQIRAAYDLATVDYINATNMYKLQRDRLINITGHNFTRLKSVSSSITLQMPEPADSTFWVRRALLNNPQLLAAKHTAHSSHHAVRRSESAHIPSLSLTARLSESESTYDRYRTPFSAFSNPGGSTTNESLEIKLSVPLYNAPILAEVDLAVIQRSIAQQNERGTTLAVRLEAATAYDTVSTSISRVKALEQALNSNLISEKIVRKSFAVGSQSSTDLINALASTKQAERDLSKARYDYLLSIFGLYAIAGNLSTKIIREYDKFIQH